MTPPGRVRRRGSVPPWRALTAAFFARFFDSDLAPGHHDLKASLFYLIAALAMPGAFAPLLMQGNSPSDPTGWGWSMIAAYRGPDALRAISRADKTLYLGFAMMASALVSVLAWTSLIPDRRDSLVLGALPVRPGAVVRARLLALSAYVGIVSAAAHALASLSFGTFLAAGATVGFALRGIAAHFVASCAASAFVLLSIAGLQGLALVSAGPRRFARLSPLLQFAVVAIVAAAVPILPAMVGLVAPALDGTGSAGARWVLGMPPLWFLGLYEAILGTDDPTLLALARAALAALAVAAAATIGSYPAAYRRLSESVAGASAPASGRRWLAEAMAVASSRQPGTRAVVQFFLATLGRSPRQRFALAAAAGVAGAWGLPAWVALASAPPSAPRADLLALPLALMCFAIGGLRLAAALPASPPAEWLFDLTPVNRRQVRLGLERVLLIAGVLPFVTLSGVAFWILWGPAIACVHALLSAAIGVLLVQVSLWRDAGMPCARPPDWTAMRRWAPGVLAGCLFTIRAVPAFELLLFRQPAAAVIFIAYLFVVAAGIRARAARSRAEEIRDPVDVLTSALRAGRPMPSEVSVTRANPTSAASADTFVARVRWPTINLFDELAVSVVLSFRRLAAAPVYTVFSILTLAAGIGLTTATYSVLRSLFWAPPPIPAAEQLVDVSGWNGRGRSTRAFSLPDFEDLAARQTTMSALAAATIATSPLVADGISEFVAAEAVNGDYFRAFGIPAAMGRLIEPADDRPGATPVVVLSYNLWRLRFGRDPAVVGRTVKIDRQTCEIVGVAARHFYGWELGFRSKPPAVWMPLATAAGEVRERRESRRRDFQWIAVKGRLAAGRSTGQASADVAAIGRALESDFPTPGATARPGLQGRRWSAGPVVTRDPNATAAAGSAALAIVGLVLLIGCTTLANLALARGSARDQERGVQRALGASRARLVREQVVESLLVTLAGGLSAIPLVRGLMAFVSMEIPLGPGQYVLVEPRVDFAVLAFACGASVLALAVSGVWPALQLTRTSVWSVLAGGGPATPPRTRLHRRLIAWQVAGSMALFLVAAACIQAVVTNARRHSGVDVDRLAIVGLDLDANGRDPIAARRTIADVLRLARRQPRVEAAAASWGLPFGAGTPGTWSIGRGDRFDEAEDAELVAGTPDIFATLGVPLAAGRRFDDRDRPEGPLVGVVSAALARRVSVDGGAVGRELVLWHRDGRGNPPTPRRLTVVGVAADTDAGRIGSREAGVVYVPLDQQEHRFVLVTIRTAGDPRAAVETLKSVVRQVDPDLAIDVAQTGTMLLGPYEVLRVAGAVASAFGTIALGLTMVGLFGVVSHLVSSRGRELGVRMALGADRGRIIWLVIADGLRPVANGLVLGLLFGALGRIAIGAFLGRSVSAVDPVAFSVVPVLLVAAGAAACYLPARRAAGLDPGVALRRS